MTDLMQDLNKFLEMLECESRKRKYLFGEMEFPPAKRQKLMPCASKRFIKRCREYHERKRKILIGLTLYWEAKLRDARRMVRKRPSCELYAEYEGFLMAKYQKLVQEPPTAAHLTKPVTTAANKDEELEMAITSVFESVDAEIEAIGAFVEEEAAKLKAASTVEVEGAVETAAYLSTPVTSIGNEVDLVELEADITSTVEAAAIVETVEAAKISAVEAGAAEVEAIEIETVQAATVFVEEEAAKLEAKVKDEMSGPPQKRRLIRRLPENVEKNEVIKIKEVVVPRRKRWRKKGEKRS